jgi:hypothetical protein
MAQARSDLPHVFAPAILLVGFSVFWFADAIADPDLWGHIRFGQDIIRTGSVLQTDVYSYRTSGQRWVNHEWLSEVIFAGVYGVSGPIGLVVFKLLISILLVGICYVHLRRSGAGPYCSVVLLVVVSIPFRMGLGTVRPHVFTYLCFLLELLILAMTATATIRWLWLLPALFAIWINLHGGVLAGVGVLGIWIVVRVIAGWWRNRAGIEHRLMSTFHLGLIGLACLGALLINPYGSELVVFLLRTGTVSRPEISEWVPISLVSLPGQIYLGLLAIGIAGLVASRRRPAPQAILIFSVAAALPLFSNRHYPLFALTLVVLAGGPMADVWNRWRRPGWASFGHPRVLAAVSVFVALLLMALSITRFGCIRIEPFYFGFPARAVALLKHNAVHGNMAVPFDWGEYVLWHLGPGIKVSIDGRRETVYSDEAYHQARDFERGEGDWSALLKTSRTDLVLASARSPIARLLSLTAGWIPLYRDTFCILFVRDGLYDIERLARSQVPNLPDDGGRLCFPAPGRAD